MRRYSGLGRALFTAMLLIATLLPAAPANAADDRAQASATPGTCTQGTLPHGARSLYCVPAAGWNGDLLVWAHGYVDPSAPLDFVQLTLPDGTSIPLLAQLLGFAFATTSYRVNGLAILEGVQDIQELIAAFPVAAGRAPRRIYLAGASEGGLVATLVAERAPHVVTGVLAACGPIADLGAHIQYLGDFRVLFDVYFPGVLPGSAIQIPQQVIDHWSDTYVPAIIAAMVAEPQKAIELIHVAGVPFDENDPFATMVSGALSLLWYSVHATNNAHVKLGGNPYGNIGRQYTGSANDADLNARVQRYQAEPLTRAVLVAYRTSGTPGVPLVVLHTTGDPLVPVWQALLYRARASASSPLTLLPVQRWGHCSFTAGEALVGLAALFGQTGAAASATARSGETQIERPSVRSSTAP